MKNLGIVSRRAGALVLSAGLVTLAAACGSVAAAAAVAQASSSSSNSITVAVAYPAPPKALLDQFTKQTGIKVTWVNIGWDDLQTKIAAAMSANTYFADAADVDWSKVGEYQKTGWFYPLNKYFNVASLRADMPQLNTFMSNNELMGMPFDSSFLVTTVNTKDFAKAGITTMPTTLAGFTADAAEGGQGQRHGQPARHPVRHRRGPVDLLVPDDRGVRRPGADRAGHPGVHLAELARVPGDDLDGQRLQERPGAQGQHQQTDYQGFTTEMAKNRPPRPSCATTPAASPRSTTCRHRQAW